VIRHFVTTPDKPHESIKKTRAKTETELPEIAVQMLTINGLSVFVRAGRWEAFWAAGHGLAVC
jgi:hypothetical protein